MTIFSRMSDILQANVNAMLDKAEEPHKMVRLMVQELEDSLANLRSTAAQHIAEQKSITRQQQALEKSTATWQQQAEKALQHNREDLARKALQEKQNAAAKAAELDSEQQVLTDLLDKLNADIAKLQGILAQARQRQNQLNWRENTATVQLRVKRQNHQVAVTEAMAKYERFEQKVERQEAEVEAFDLGQTNTLAAEIDQLAANDAVENELKELQQRMQKGAA